MGLRSLGLRAYVEVHGLWESSHMTHGEARRDFISMKEDPTQNGGPNNYQYYAPRFLALV